MSAKILIVEDEPAIQELLAFNAVQAGFQALRAEDADSAWRQKHSHLPDWLLPGTSGVALAKQLRADAQLAGLIASATDMLFGSFSPRMAGGHLPQTPERATFFHPAASLIGHVAEHPHHHPPYTPT